MSLSPEFDLREPDAKLFLFYDHSTALVLDSVSTSDKRYRFKHIKILEINCSISLEILFLTILTPCKTRDFHANQNQASTLKHI